MYKIREFRSRLYIAIMAVIAIGLVFLVVEVNAQNTSANDIATRLIQKGVNIKYVNIVSRVPYVVEIALQSSSDNRNLTQEDNWFMVLASREATLAYRIGIRLNSYKLIVFNTKGDVIFSNEIYLYPQDLNQNLPSTVNLKVDNQQAREIVLRNLDLAGLSLERLDVYSDDKSGSLGQVLLIQVSTTDLDVANKSLPRFLNSFLTLQNTINEKYGTDIVLCHLTVLDQQGKVLLDYVRDLEGGNSQWSQINGLYSDWFPHPEKPVPSASPTPSSGAYPGPTPYP